MGLYWGYFIKVIEDLVTIMVSNVLAIPCVNYVGQKFKNVFVQNGSDLAHILVESNLLHKPLNTVDILPVSQWISSKDHYSHIISLF